MAWDRARNDCVMRDWSLWLNPSPRVRDPRAPTPESLPPALPANKKHRPSLLTNAWSSQRTRYVDPLLDQCWASVCDAGPTLIQQWVLCLLGYVYLQAFGDSSRNQNSATHNCLAQSLVAQPRHLNPWCSSLRCGRSACGVLGQLNVGATSATSTQHSRGAEKSTAHPPPTIPQHLIRTPTTSWHCSGVRWNSKPWRPKSGAAVQHLAIRSPASKDERVWANAGFIVVLRLRSWPNVEPALVQSLVSHVEAQRYLGRPWVSQDARPSLPACEPCRRLYHSKHEKLTKCLVNVGTASSTLAQH